jgi:exodeoxyribonuclease VII small subunit
VPHQESNEEHPVSFEQALLELETIVHDLDEGRLGLTEALVRYEAGIKLLKECHTLLAAAERRIELLSGVDAEGNPVAEPFDEEAAATLEEKSRNRSKRRSTAAVEPAPKRPGPRKADVDDAAGLF